MRLVYGLPILCKALVESLEYEYEGGTAPATMASAECGKQSYERAVWTVDLWDRGLHHGAVGWGILLAHFPLRWGT